MTLEQIISMAIPITAKDCEMVKAQKEELRVRTKERLIAWRQFGEEYSLTELSAASKLCIEHNIIPQDKIQFSNNMSAEDLNKINNPTRFEEIEKMYRL